MVALSGLMQRAEPAVLAVFYQDKPYDIAALKLIVEEAGSIVRDIFGIKQQYHTKVSGTLITTPNFFGTVAELAHTTISSYS